MLNNSEFNPAWWLSSPHGQTMWPSLFRRRKPLKATWERVELADGDFIDLAWGGTPTKEQPIVLILHGLGGNVSSPYASGLMKALIKQGMMPVLIHCRGCSGEPNRYARSYHSGDTGDLAFVVEKLIKTHPIIYAVGFSMGGNVLLKWLGETGTKNPLSKAVAVSVPFLLNVVADRINTGFSRVYQKNLLNELKKGMRRKFKKIACPFDITLIDRVNNFWEFDDQITAPLHGFKGVKDYYKRSSCRQYLKGITVPTLIIQSMDDPFMTIEAVPYPSELSSSTTMILTEKGGHVGFISGKFPGLPEYWLEKVIPEFLSAGKSH